MKSTSNCCRVHGLLDALSSRAALAPCRVENRCECRRPWPVSLALAFETRAWSPKTGHSRSTASSAVDAFESTGFRPGGGSRASTMQDATSRTYLWISNSGRRSASMSSSSLARNCGAIWSHNATLNSETNSGSRRWQTGNIGSSQVSCHRPTLSLLPCWSS